MTGQITTCYSFKGGSGRSMALANVAWILAARGLRVLAVDWDLEAPGLHRYFHPFLDDPLQQDATGLIDGLWDFVNAAPEGAAANVAEYADATNYVQQLKLPFTRGKIDFLGAGRQDDFYTQKVGRFDWMTFYARLNGSQFIDSIGKWARANYDHILIDSRTGVSDTAGICTVQLPDTLAFFFVYNRQSIEGIAAAARAVRSQRKKSSLRMLVCPSRVEDRKLAEPARHHAAFCLEDVLEERPQDLARKLKASEIPHFAWCAYEEKLAIFEEEPEESGTLLQTMEALATRITCEEPVDTQVVSREVLKSYWRRAAFRDPRLDELEAFRTGSLAQRVPQLKLWLGESVEEPAKALDWPMTLARECAAVAVIGYGTVAADDLEKLGSGAIELARQLRGRPGVELATLVDIFRSRAVQLRREGRFDEAYEIATEAVEMGRADERPGTQSAMVRALELRAEVAKLAGMADAALDDLRRLVDHYESKGVPHDPRHPLGRARAHRLLAEAMLDQGDRTGAFEQAAIALKIASSFGDHGGGSAEAALARLAHARTALASQHPEAEKFVKRNEAWLERSDLPSSARTEILFRLRMAFADYYGERGNYDRAFAVLADMPEGLPAHATADIAEAKVRLAEAKSGRLAESAQAHGHAPTPEELVDFLHKALAETGDDRAAREQLLRNFVDRAVRLPQHSDDALAELIPRLDQKTRALVMKALREILSQASPEANRLAS